MMKFITFLAAIPLAAYSDPGQGTEIGDLQ